MQHCHLVLWVVIVYHCLEEVHRVSAKRMEKAWMCSSRKISMLPSQQKILEFPWKKAGLGGSKSMHEAYLEFPGGGGLRKIPSVGKVLDSCWNYTIYMLVLSPSVTSKKCKLQSGIAKTELAPHMIPWIQQCYICVNTIVRQDLPKQLYGSMPPSLTQRGQGLLTSAKSYTVHQLLQSQIM